MMDRRIKSTTGPTTGPPLSSGIAEIPFACNGPLPDRNPGHNVSAAWPSPNEALAIGHLRAFTNHNYHHDILATVHVLDRLGTETTAGPVRIPQSPAVGEEASRTAAGFVRQPLPIAIPASSLVWVECAYDPTSFLIQNDLLILRGANDALHGGTLGAWRGQSGTVVALDSTTPPHAGVGKILRITPGGAAAVATDDSSNLGQYDSLGIFEFWDGSEWASQFGYAASAWFQSVGGTARDVTLSVISTDTATPGPTVGSITLSVPGDGAWHELAFTVPPSTLIYFLNTGPNGAFLRVDIDSSSDVSTMLMSDISEGFIEFGGAAGGSVGIALELA